MTNFHNEIHDSELMLLESKATQIGKMLLGSLLVAKDGGAQRAGDR
jgi:hypothetical protein